MAGNAVDELINNLYEMVQDAWSMPLGRERCVVDRDKVLDILDEIRASLPSDLRTAKDLLEKRDTVIANAKKEAESIKTQAEEYARNKINDHEIMVQARKKASEIISNAEARSKEIVKAAGAFCDDALKQTEESISQSLGSIQRSRTQLKTVIREQQTVSAGSAVANNVNP